MGAVALRILVIVGILTFPVAAQAAPPVYFHKPNVPRADFLADINRCVELAGGVRVETPYSYQPTLVGAAAAGFIGGLFAGAERRQKTNNVLRTCMADKGYRRVEMPDAVSDSLKKLKTAERAERLAALAASVQPEGEVLPP
jgi:hypothetical protein